MRGTLKRRTSLEANDNGLKTGRRGEARAAKVEYMDARSGWAFMYVLIKVSMKAVLPRDFRPSVLRMARTPW